MERGKAASFPSTAFNYLWRVFLKKSIINIMVKKSYIYIISNGNSYKVGISNNPEKRLLQLQTGNHNKLKIEKTYEVDKKKIFKIEKEIHNFLQKKYQKRGEWFSNATLFGIIIVAEEIIEEFEKYKTR